MNLQETLRQVERGWDTVNTPRYGPQIREDVKGKISSQGLGVENLITYRLIKRTVRARSILFYLLGDLQSNPAAEAHVKARLALAGKKPPDSFLLFKEVENELLRRGFVDFVTLDNGSIALVLEATHSNGTKAAIRFVMNNEVRPSSIGILPPHPDVDSSPILLSCGLQAEILPVGSDRFVRAYEREKAVPKEKLWDQRLVYVTALLHGEGKLAWEDVHRQNIVEWNNTIWIADPDGFRTDVDVRAFNAKTIKDILNNHLRELIHPANGRLITTEFFAVANNCTDAEVDKILAWARANKDNPLHVIEVPDIATAGRYLLVVDLKRGQDGPSLAGGLRQVLGTPSGTK